MKIKNVTIYALSFLCISICFAQGSNKVEPVHDIFKNYPKVRDFTRSNSQNEIYFTVQSPLEEVSVITLMEIKNDSLHLPVIATFSGKYKDLEPFLSPDNKSLYFVSNRPLNQNDEETKDFDIWYVERVSIDSDWSKPINLGAPVNTEYDEFYPSVSNNNNLYFTRNSPDSSGEDDIFYSQWKDAVYSKPKPLSNSINTEGYEFNSYVAPDESFLVFSGYNRKDGLGSGDLYISRNENGTWMQAENLGEVVNSKHMDYCPFIDINSGTLYFTSTRSSVDLKEYSKMKKLNQEIQKYENGLSRIYKVNISNVLTKN
jgi:tricorn protease-like protein